ncbi:aminotransferase V [Spirochaetia bacterium]|nr:aminotransferase V [Spirochaetia bacterium]
MSRVYFDWASSAEIEYFGGNKPPKACESWNGTHYPFGNPSSKHSEGRIANDALTKARIACAEALGVGPQTIYFTSGGTESNNIIIFSALQHFADAGIKKTIFTSEAEHPSVLENCKTLQKFGFPLHYVPLNECGAVDADTLLRSVYGCAGDADDGVGSGSAIKSSFISLMAVNNETGSISDIKGLADALRAVYGNRTFFHSDIVQAIGKVTVDLKTWDIDAVSISGHKIGAPRGIGLLYLKKPIIPLCKGGSQENGIRGGTQNTAGAIELSRRLTYALSEFDGNYCGACKRMGFLQDALRTIKRCRILPQARLEIKGNYGETGIYGENRFSPYILQVAFENLPGEVMQRLLDDAGFAVSTGSACSQNSTKRPVLFAMGINEKDALNGIRISQGFGTRQDEVEDLICAIKKILEKY